MMVSFRWPFQSLLLLVFFFDVSTGQKNKDHKKKASVRVNTAAHVFLSSFLLSMMNSKSRKNTRKLRKMGRSPTKELIMSKCLSHLPLNEYSS
jgi:predicted membrane channel-forming protein YqfA (hemolysin III family)